MSGKRTVDSLDIMVLLVLTALMAVTAWQQEQITDLRSQVEAHEPRP